ncbi:MAG: hypothetical protein E7298_09135 [Lachnospiraceae bacterium]|nr:hypothetical protein [Lachnospiraceae bacterium]
MDNFIRVRCFSPFHHRYIFVDTKDYVSIRLFAAADIGVSHIKEMLKRGSPYRLIVCHVRKKDLDKFYDALGKLRNNVMILGYKDYDKVCEKLKEGELILSGRKEREKKKMEKNTRFYLLYDHLLGKEEGGQFFLYKDKAWIPDHEHMIMDHLTGYDPSEPPDSPYGIYCTDIMEEIKEISPEKAMEMMG